MLSDHAIRLPSGDHDGQKCHPAAPGARTVFGSPRPQASAVTMASSPDASVTQTIRLPSGE